MEKVGRRSYRIDERDFQYGVDVAGQIRDLQRFYGVGTVFW